MKRWFNKQHIAIRLSLSFILYCCLWLAIELLVDFIGDVNREWSAIVFMMCWMGTFWTIFYNWDDVKKVFRKKQGNGTR